MRKLVFICLTATLAVPAWAVAASPPSAADRAAASKQCSTERASMGVAAFKLLYGTNANRSNAFGKCVSKNARAEHKAHSNAVSDCKAERDSLGETAFNGKYGTNRKQSNAFGKCVSQKARENHQEDEDSETPPAS
jgi:Tfp pilus assembly protein PilW